MEDCSHMGVLLKNVSAVSGLKTLSSSCCFDHSPQDELCQCVHTAVIVSYCYLKAKSKPGCNYSNMTSLQIRAL